MNRHFTADLSRRAFRDLAADITPAELEQFRLERLLELRAVIDAMRAERTLDRLHRHGRTDFHPAR